MQWHLFESKERQKNRQINLFNVRDADQKMELGRFGQHSPEEFINRRLNVDASSTQKANRRAGNVLRQYLIEMAHENVDFENFSKTELNKILRSFYLDIRKVNGDKYKTSSLESFRHSLNRHIQSRRPDVNIIKDTDFTDANISYRTMMTELKKDGLGMVTHYPVICSTNLEKLYKSKFLDPTLPVGLLNKVQFDIRMYFMRRGAENMHTMKKKHFQNSIS